MKVYAIGRKEFSDAMKAAGISTAINAEEKAVYWVDSAVISDWKEKLKGKAWSVIEWLD